VFSQIFLVSPNSSQRYTPVRMMSTGSKIIKSNFDFKNLIVFESAIFTFSNRFFVKSCFMNPWRASIYRLRGQKPPLVDLIKI
jgi:hypothetical protein